MSLLAGKTVLLTGATGFIGKRVYPALVQAHGGGTNANGNGWQRPASRHRKITCATWPCFTCRRRMRQRQLRPMSCC